MATTHESIRYCVVVSKKHDIIEGPDDATVTITVSLADAADVDPTTAYMLGRLKATGSTGALFRGLRSGEVATTLRRIAQDHAGRGSQ
jgi:hypothetical protein